MLELVVIGSLGWPRSWS